MTPPSSSDSTIILGAGMTGAAAGYASGAPVYEQASRPGGICSSYYLAPGSNTRHVLPDTTEDLYRFEIGGGHWIFGGDPLVHDLLSSLVTPNTYHRNSATYFPERDLYVPYPIQNNLRYFDDSLAAQCLQEMVQGARSAATPDTMAEWLEHHFGPTLSDLFFHPFNESYTAGLWQDIAPQDKYKTPLTLSHAIQGAHTTPPDVGYNASFVYPEEGLDVLAKRLADRADVRYDKEAVHIDPEEQVVHFSDHTSVPYDTLLSTLPLNRMMDLTRLPVEAPANPCPSVLVHNIGAERGPNCPDHHWLYLPDTDTGFHRVGFYSNVDPSFVPHSRQQDHVSIYVETATLDPDAIDLNSYTHSVISELQSYGFIRDPEVVDPTWIEDAYTWRYPNNTWTEQSLTTLREHNIQQVGRYARWVFQGIADSIKDGLFAGAALR